MNYLGKFWPSIAQVCEQLRKLISPKCEWKWNDKYQYLNDRAKSILEKDASIAFYSDREQLYLEWCVGCRSRSSSLQVRDWMWFPRNEASDSAVLPPVVFKSKSLKWANPVQLIEREELGTQIVWKIPQWLVHPWGKPDHGPRSTDSNIQERCCKPCPVDFKEYF